MSMFRFEDNWFEYTPYLRKLNDMGYTVLRVDGKYVLYKVKERVNDEIPRAEILGEYQTQEELENMCKLLLPEGKQDEQ